LAVGNGKTDDTKAIQSALDAVAAAGGGIVFVPTGIYLIKTHLVVREGTSLVGVARAPARYMPDSPGTTLLAVEGAGNGQGTPFIALHGPNSTLEGISVFYPNQVIADKPIP
jgi:polygalacturonase